MYIMSNHNNSCLNALGRSKNEGEKHFIVYYVKQKYKPNFKFTFNRFHLLLIYSGIISFSVISSKHPCYTCS